MVTRSIDRTADARLPGASNYAIQIQGSILIAPTEESAFAVKIRQMIDEDRVGSIQFYGKLKCWRDSLIKRNVIDSRWSNDKLTDSHVSIFLRCVKPYRSTRLVVFGHRHSSIETRASTLYTLCLFISNLYEICISSELSNINQLFKNDPFVLVIVMNHPFEISYTRMLPQFFHYRRVPTAFKVLFNHCLKSAFDATVLAGIGPLAFRLDAAQFYFKKSCPVSHPGSRIKARANWRRAT